MPLSTRAPAMTAQTVALGAYYAARDAGLLDALPPHAQAQLARRAFSPREPAKRAVEPAKEPSEASTAKLCVQTADGRRWRVTIVAVPDEDDGPAEIVLPAQAFALGHPEFSTAQVLPPRTPARAAAAPLPQAAARPASAVRPAKSRKIGRPSVALFCR
jgi:hypothetical protein